MTIYIGWVPCINGHLDFGLMKPGITGGFTNYDVKDKRSTLVNFARTGQPDHHARRIMLQSKVDWLDSKPAETHDGQFRIFLTAEVQCDNHLDGRTLFGSIYIYRAGSFEESKEANFSTDYFATIHGAEDCYNDWKKYKGRLSWARTRQDLNVYYSILLRQLEVRYTDNHNFWKLNFAVEPDGIIYLDSSSLCKTHYSEHERYIISRQAYYYIKYSLHDHKHHEHQADSLTSLVPINGFSGVELEQASLRLLGQLKRELTHIKRSLATAPNSSTSEALGIISYMKSLLATLAAKDFISNHLANRERQYLSSAEESFRARSMNSETGYMIERDSKHKISSIFNTALAVIAIFVSVLIYWHGNTSKYFDDEPAQAVNSLTLLVVVGVIVFLFFTLLYFLIAKGYVARKLAGHGFNQMVRERYVLKKIRLFGITLKFLKIFGRTYF